jgi:hypothetical protein
MKKTVKQLQNFFAELEEKHALPFSPNDYGDWEDLVDQDDLDFSLIRDVLESKGAFEIEIISYWEAIQYLAENDSSLRESLDIAQEYGLDLDALSSEVLASLLASRKAYEQFANLKNVINNFLQN